jgi:16S rRNA (guanine527-N7)-methyltransferase
MDERHAVTPENIAKLLQPYVASAATDTDWPLVHAQLTRYLELILKWNARTNLTAIRSPEEIVRRHFGESLFVGAQLGECPTLLDFGSGAGFPGIPIQLLRPDIQVTLAESQGKKASFLREVVRTLGLPTEIWPARVESMPESRRFHTVALRAVDNMEAAIEEAGRRAAHRVALLTTRQAQLDLPTFTEAFKFSSSIQLPESASGILAIAYRV